MTMSAEQARPPEWAADERAGVGVRLIADIVVSSDVVRARRTAEAVAAAARDAGEILLDPSLYLAGPADILSRCERCGRTPRP
jgi:phosphohistidine phosphatase SixA